MAVTLIWSIHRCKRDSDTGGITGVCAVCTATDTRMVEGEEVTHKKQKYVVYDELTPDPSSIEFIPFENLTQQDILTWVDNLLGSSKKQEIETTLKNKVNDKFVPSSSLGNPWD